MDKANRSLFSRWAMFGAIAGLGLVGLNHAIGGSQPGVPSDNRPLVRMNGLELRGSFDKRDWPKLRLWVDVSNPGNQAVRLDSKIKLVLYEFKGNLAARVSRPGDTKITNLETKPLEATVAPGKLSTYTVMFDAAADASAKFGRVSYMAMLDASGKPQTVGFVAPPAPVLNKK